MTFFIITSVGFILTTLLAIYFVYKKRINYAEAEKISDKYVTYSLLLVVTLGSIIWLIISERSS